MDPRFGDVPPTGIKSPLGHFFDLSSLAWIFTFREYLTSRVGDAIRARAAAGTPPSRAHSPPGCPAPRELVASGNVADGNRQLVWNPEFCEPAVKRLAEVSDSLFWSLPLAVSTATRQRRAGGPPASFILFRGVRHVHNTVHEAILPTAHPMGAENLVQSSDQAVFVDHAVGANSDRRLRCGSRACGSRPS